MKGWLLYCLLTFCLIGCSGRESNGGRQINGPSYQPLLRPSPTDESRRAIQVYPRGLKDTNWQVLRQYPSGEIQILARGAAGWQDVKFQGSSSVHLRYVVESNEALYLFTYDVEHNHPSGRSLQSAREGIDVWRVERSSTQASPLALGLPLGGIDDAIVARASRGTVDACGGGKCIRLKDDGQVQNWASGVPAGYEFLEVRFDGDDDAFALVRRAPNRETGNYDFEQTPYAVVTLQNPESGNFQSVQDVQAECLPFRIRLSSKGQPVWSCARSAKELAEVFQSDFDRQLLNNLADIGMSNVEGRIAWSLVYTLGAILDLDAANTPLLVQATDWSGVKGILVEAVDLVARQGSDHEMGYASRRYSIDRSPLLFALHLGRIAALLSDAEAAGFASESTALQLQRLREQLDSLADTVETPMQVGSKLTLGYRKGARFWADGSNVPHNYVSGYVHGLLASTSRPTDVAFHAADLLAPLVQGEKLASSDVWNYWWGVGFHGWAVTDGISLNTGGYSGYTGVAHISYRSMDAAAVARLATVDPSLVDSRVIENIQRLVRNGGLLPFVIRDLVRLGPTQGLDASVAMRFARSANPIDLHSQLFALEALARAN